MMSESEVIAQRRRVGNNVRLLRNQRHLSLRELATRSGMNYSYLWRVEHGTSSPTVDTLARLADALDTTLQSLL